jgi:hypothetical protein
VVAVVVVRLLLLALEGQVEAEQVRLVQMLPRVAQQIAVVVAAATIWVPKVLVVVE